jgi:hypothetical protein
MRMNILSRPILELGKALEKGKVVKMTSNVNLRKCVEGERVVFDFYLILDTCKFTLKPKFALS